MERDWGTYLDPLSQLIALDVSNSLREDLQVLAGRKESNLLTANLVHRLHGNMIGR